MLQKSGVNHVESFEKKILLSQVLQKTQTIDEPIDYRVHGTKGKPVNELKQKWICSRRSLG